jgi:hypothetical protein
LLDFPNVRRWFDEVSARPAVQRAYDIGKRPPGRLDEAGRKVLAAFRQQGAVEHHPI